MDPSKAAAALASMESSGEGQGEAKRLGGIMSARALTADSLVQVRLVVLRRAPAAESNSVMTSELTSLS